MSLTQALRDLRPSKQASSEDTARRRAERWDALARAIRDPAAAAEDMDAAGRLLRKTTEQVPGTPLDVYIAGQCTTAWLANAIVAVAFGQGVRVRVREAEYDNVMQGLMSLAREPATP